MCFLFIRNAASKLMRCFAAKFLRLCECELWQNPSFLKSSHTGNKKISTIHRDFRMKRYEMLLWFSSIIPTCIGIAATVSHEKHCSLSLQSLRQSLSIIMYVKPIRKSFFELLKFLIEGIYVFSMINFFFITEDASTVTSISKEPDSTCMLTVF